MARREATAEQTTAEQLAQQQKRVQRVQQKKAAIAAGEEWVEEWEVAGYFSEGYYSGSNSDCSSGDREAEVAATAMREWDGQHGWLHSPEERAADRSEAEQELARVMATLRVWHAAAVI